MASIDKRTDGRYRARWREYPGGPQRSRHFDRKADAERFLDGVRGDLARGAYIDPAGGRTLFGEYAEVWRRAQVHRPTTAVLVEGLLRRHMLPFFAARPLASIRPSEVQAWVRGRSTVLAPATTKVAFRFFSAILKSAVRDRLIATSPCDQIKLPKVHRRQVVPLETDASLEICEIVEDALNQGSLRRRDARLLLSIAVGHDTIRSRAEREGVTYEAMNERWRRARNRLRLALVA